MIINHNTFIEHTAIYVTRHEKTMLMYTKYTSLRYLDYLASCASFTTSVNCIEFIIVFCTISISFIDTLYLDKKLLKIQNLKSSQILCAHKQYFLMPGHICRLSALDHVFSSLLAL